MAFAAGLDGASSFSQEQPEPDGGWYAETLAAQLQELLNAEPERPLAAIVERAIQGIVAEHRLEPDTSPTSTIALTRWNNEQVQAYVLGDSTVAVIRQDGKEVVYSDDRLASIGGDLRRAYRERLAAGGGFDDEHLRLLASLQAEQAKWRNREDGYWTAGADPDAAYHGIMREFSRTELQQVILATDGAAVGFYHYRNFPAWHALQRTSAEEVLETLADSEAQDPHGRRWPRSKPQDDKTLCVLRLCD